ncbi:MAG: T9SS type A sorting domain-containing protein [Bacteroidota bacterium]
MRFSFPFFFSRILPFFIILNFLSELSIAQEYIPLVQEGAWWKTTYVNNSWKFFPKYLIKGDTTINGVDYKKMYSCPDLKGFIREDTIEKKVFARYFSVFDSNCPENDEFLLFDFSLEVGDTIQSCWFGASAQLDTVAVVSSEFLFGQDRKSIAYTTVFPTTSIIEGLGSTEGGPVTVQVLGVSGVTGDINDYGVNPETTCSDLLVSAEQAINNHEIDVYPNPAATLVEIYVDALLAANSQAIFYSLGGKQLKTIELESNRNLVRVDDLPPGIVILYIKDYKGRISTPIKFVITH